MSRLGWTGRWTVKSAIHMSTWTTGQPMYQPAPKHAKFCHVLESPVDKALTALHGGQEADLGLIYPA